jgi:hypothetical protein
LLTRLNFQWDANKDRNAGGPLVDPFANLTRLTRLIETGLFKRAIEVKGIEKVRGYYDIDIKNQDFELGVRIGYLDNSNDGFFLFIEPHRTVVRKWFRRIDAKPAVEALQRALEQILKDDCRVRRRKWYSFESYKTIDVR